MKKHIYWLISLIICSLSLALATKANFGLSMIGAVPYIVHVFLAQYWPWFTQGVSEYVVEGIILLVTCLIIQRFRWKYLLSFGTAVLSGFLIDFWLWVFGGGAAYESMTIRIIAFTISMVGTAIGIAFMFKTDLAPQVYELSVIEIADRFHFKKTHVKYFFDYSMLAIALILSFALTHKFTGIGIGTIIITLLNSVLISLFVKIFDSIENAIAKKKDH